MKHIPFALAVVPITTFGLCPFTNCYYGRATCNPDCRIRANKTIHSYVDFYRTRQDPHSHTHNHCNAAR